LNLRVAIGDGAFGPDSADESLVFARAAT
jgi:hypothetical protein